MLLGKKISRCEQCGAPLKSGAIKLGCLNCLLLGGPNESSPETRRFQHYEICLREDGVTLDELGRGAMGITYHARDINLKSSVALKVISAGYSGNLGARARFLREARAAAQLRHPNVASVFHFGETAAGQCFYAMELVEGETLEARVRRDGPLPPMLVLDVAIQVARALIAAEAQGLVHRDLKPSNLMLVAGDSGDADTLVVKVIDFGLAKAVAAMPVVPGQTHAGFSGTPDFASPEQFSAGEVSLDTRSDIYSLGATLWYLLCGRTPFDGRSPGEVHDQPLPLEQLAEAKTSAPMVAILRSMLAADPVGRPQSAGELLTALRRCRQAMEARPRRRKLLKWAALAIAFVTIGAVGLTNYFSHHSSTAMMAPEKSIAVLPFDSLSNDKENSFFAVGVQDEILRNLGRIADLKVISRTSVAQYKSGTARNLREIAQQLGVAHVLEGSVQRVANRVRVNAQLIDARTDAHIWAEHYDRDLADVFAIQSEIAQAIAEQLHAKISAGEKAAVAERPTSDLVAYDLYIRAAALIDHAGLGSRKEQEKDYLQAVELLNQAIARDPAFLLAYCRLAGAHDELYFQSHDHTPARLALANSAINAAFRLKPDSGEAHLARATHLYHGYFDYDHARDELAIAIRALPNNARIFEWTGYIDRRQGRWHDAVRNLERASELDPRNVKVLIGAAVTYNLMNDYGQARETLDRVIALEPNDDFHLVFRAWIDVEERADTRPLHAVIEKILRDDPASAGELVHQRLFLARAEHDPVAADRAVAALTDNTFGVGKGTIYLIRYYVQGLVARMKGDTVAARVAFTAARAQQEEAVRARPDHGPALCVLGLINAALGRKEEALREGRRAVELLPVAKNALDGPDVLYIYAVICASTGELDLAIEQLQTLAKIPGGQSYGELRLDADWDPLRGDPRFEKMVASLKP